MTDSLELDLLSPKMLIADDDPTIVRLLADRCTKMGFKVETATNGIQALVMARRSPPDILIVDVNMPQLDGLSICERLLDPHGKPLEVVVITGSADPETVERCEGFGTFYGRKGPDFWNMLGSALVEIYPNMADKISEFAQQSANSNIRKRPCVLVVDDDLDMEKFFKSRLNKYGVDTLYASDAVQGFRMAYKNEPNVIISDYHMPRGDALYLLWRLRTTPITENIPVLIMSGFLIDEVTEQNLKREICGRPGALHVFGKSFDTGELFGAVQQFCGFEKNTPSHKSH